MEEKRMEMNEAVVMNEEELAEVNGGIVPVLAALGGCYVLGYVAGRVIKGKTGVCKA